MPLFECRGCGAKLPRTGHYFYRSKASADGLQSRCKRCDGSTGARGADVSSIDRTRGPNVHTVDRKRSYERPADKQEICGVCADLSHRRIKPSCPGCGERYKPEPPKTIEDVLAAPRDYSREVVL